MQQFLKCDYSCWAVSKNIDW